MWKMITAILAIIICEINSQTDPLPVATCTPNQNSKGEFHCQISTNTNANLLECAVVSGIQCTATFTSQNDVSESSTKLLIFKMNLVMQKYIANPVKVTFQVSSSGGSKTNLAQELDVTYPYSNDEKPRLECSNPMAVGDGFTYWSTCQAYFAEQTDSLTSNPVSGCTVELSQFTKFPDKLLFSQKVNVRFNVQNRKCNTQCNAKVSIPNSIDESNPRTNKAFAFPFSCKDPSIYIVGHDKLSRDIDFLIDAVYEYEKIQVSITSPSGGTATPNEFQLNTPELKKTLNKFKYTVSNPLNTNPQLIIKFKIFQNGDSLAHEKSITLEYGLKNDEIESLICKPKEVVGSQNLAENTYECDIKARAASVTLQLEDTRYSINPNTAITLSGTNSLKTKTQDIRITSSNVNCNLNKQIKIKFQTSSLQSCHVTHVTQCPEPTITCNQHNLQTRQITCSIQIDFQFMTLKMTSSSAHVAIEPISIPFNEIPVRTLTTKIISYTLKNIRRDAIKNFNIMFNVIQKNHHVAFTKTISFEYILKNEELPHINCWNTQRAEGAHFASNQYHCTLMAPEWKVTLKVKELTFTLSPESVTGHSANQMYQHSGFDVVITPKSILCKSVQDVTIYFSESQTIEHSFKTKHITTCPDPIIDCSEHDFSERTIRCRIQILFPFHAIELTKSGNVQLTEGSSLLYTDYTKSGGNEHVVKYEISDLTATNHEFSIEFKAFHDASNSQEASKQTIHFSYLLKQNEVPGLICNEKTRESTQPNAETRFSCVVKSKSQPVTISTDQTGFEVVATIPTNVVSARQLYTFTDVGVKITSQSFECGKKSQVDLYFNDGETKHSYGVTHESFCPEHSIYCTSNDLVARALNCKFIIQYKFSSIEASIAPTHVSFEGSTNTKQIHAGANSINQDTQIKYSVKDFKRNDHQFTITFSVKQPNNKISYSRSFKFDYELKIDESPHISCKPKIDVVVGENFEETKYNCEIISRQSKPMIKLKSNEYAITQNSEAETDLQNLYKQQNSEFTIKPKQIICGKDTNLEIYFKDEDGNNHEDLVSHSIKCPSPHLAKQEQDSTNRKVTVKIEARYEFTAVVFKSEVSTVQITPKEALIVKDGEKWTCEVEIAYQPIDWSYNQHKFSVIGTVMPLENSEGISVTTTLFTFDLVAKELPKIVCSSMNNKELQFIDRLFTCKILSRGASISLNVEQNGYRIVLARGEASHSQNVYHWNDYQIVIQDLQIKCNLNQDLSVSFTEYTQNYKTVVKYQTICPDPEISCTKDDESRNVICEVKSQFPHTELDVKSEGEINLLHLVHSNILRKGSHWHSTHTIPFELKNLKLVDRQFTLKLTVFQDHRNIFTKSLPFTYVLKENELPQIKCQKDKVNPSNNFDRSTYLCYIVTEQSQVSLSILPSHYNLDLKMGSGSDFLGLYKWENVRVTVKDERILCNETSDITIKMTDNEIDRSTVVQHTTLCDEIDGNCEIQYKEFAFVICNLSSSFEFKLKEYRCSEIMNCSMSMDLNAISNTYQQYLFDVMPMIQSSVVDFEFNITLSYSDYSNVTLTYQIEYTAVSDIEVQEKSGNVAAASTRVFSWTLVIGPACLISVYLTYKLTKRKSSPTK